MMDQHRPQRTREFIEKAIEKFESLGNKKGLAEAYMAYGLYHKYKFYIPTADAALYSVEELLKRSDYSKLRPYTENIDYDKSEEYYRKAIQNFQDTNSYEGLSRAYAVLATLYQMENKKELMLASIDRSEKYYRQMKEQDPKAESRLVLEKNQTLPDFLKELRKEAIEV
jgi:TPR repeat protein